MSEELRTYVELEIGGEKLRLTPNPRSLMRVSKEIGDPMIMILQMQIGGKPPELVQVFRVIRIALEESGHSYDEDKFEQLMFDAGVESLYVPFAEFIGGLVNSGVIPREEKGGNRASRRAKKSKEGKTPSE